MADTGSPAPCPDLLRQRLVSGTPTFLMAVRAWPMAEAVHLAAVTGHHGIYIDMQHGAIGIETASQLCLVAVALRLPALVRVPVMDPALIGAVLDNGAAGVMVPDVDDVETARRALASSRHPPAGNRSVAAPRAFATQARPFMALMIETPRGVAAAASIAALADVDALVVGTGDLAANLEEKDTLNTHIAAVVAAGRAHGVPVILAGLRDSAAARRATDAGAAACFIVGTDMAYLMDGARRQVGTFQDVFSLASQTHPD